VRSILRSTSSEVGLSGPHVTSRHLLGFGGIIHHYAFAELGIKTALAHVIGVSLTDVVILSEPYTSLSLKNVAKSLVKARTPITPEGQRFLQLVADFATFSQIRNKIAHTRWVVGDRPNSIRSAGIDIRDGKPVVIGVDRPEPDWTPEELYAESDKIAALAGRISKFLIDTGAASSMEEKIIDGCKPTV
jgi:hypothetical protein